MEGSMCRLAGKGRERSRRKKCVNVTRKEINEEKRVKRKSFHAFHRNSGDLDFPLGIIKIRSVRL